VRVLHVASEVAPFAQSGGLADVVAGLPAAQAAMGLDVAVCVPLYQGVPEQLAAAGVTLGPPVPLPFALGTWPQVPAALRIATVGAVRYAFIDIPPLYDRPGLYGPGGPAEFGDNAIRFGALGKAATLIGPKLFGASPDVLHVHDWQGGPAAVFARMADLPSIVVATIHNLAYRGIFPKSAMTELGIPWSFFTLSAFEFYDQVSLLKGGCGLADAVTTVSPTYAREILTPERGEALDAFLRLGARNLTGIVNGIDVESWDPATDPTLAAPFSRADRAGRARCRAALAQAAGMPLAPDEPLLGVIARMTGQKGLDLVAELAPLLPTLRARLVVLGAGEPDLENRFRWLGTVLPEHVSTTIGFSGSLARQIYGGCDLFVMPSRFEPCGLGQLYAMRYGAVPIVHAVGGLRDTVDDPRTGIRFDVPTVQALAAAVERGVRLFRDRPAFDAVQSTAMARDSSWAASAREYSALYRSLRPAVGRVRP
jgi:starch synthase